MFSFKSLCQIIFTEKLIKIDEILLFKVKKLIG